jgi:radical SAM protein with 4Fe4S-binding SPASM domain
MRTLTGGWADISTYWPEKENLVRRIGDMLSIGIGLTNNCDLSCAHCYRDQDRIDNLTFDDIRKVCENLEVGSIGFGTGENGLNPDYFKILDYLREKRIKLTLASNGYTLSITPDDKLRYFSDLEFSIDFPDRGRQDRFRGEGNWRTVMAGIERCNRLGIRVSILAVLMNLNYADLGTIAGLAASLRADFRVNVYQPMHTDKFIPSYDEYWEAYRILFDRSEIISVTEPLVNTFIGGSGLNGTPCGGKSLRITPRRFLKACVYWPESHLTIDDLVEQKEDIFTSSLFKETHNAPLFCRSCMYLENCGGGCAARRVLRGRPDEPDEYCPVFRGKTMDLRGRTSAAPKPLRTGSICTTIVRGTA